VGNDIEGFVQLIGQDKWDEALDLLRETNPLPGVTGRVCNSPCEQACNRGNFDAMVSIRTLERSLADYAAKRGIKQNAIIPKHKEKVAVIGSGPAGLSCAYQLTRQGFSCTVFEQKPQVGGILRYGIPSYRLPKGILDGEVELIRNLGVDFRVNRKWGENLRMEDLKGYDALFLALGFQKCQMLGIPGEESSGVMAGTDFLERVNSGTPPALAGDVLIIGGGNSAVDSARAALRLGAKPILIYRRREEDMPAISSEIEEMKAEGVDLRTMETPVRFVSNHGRLVAVECVRMELGEIMADGRRWPVPVPGSEFKIPANAVILCLGETGNLEEAPIELTCKGERIDTDPWGRTSIPKVFAGGDIATGNGTVAHAIGSGRSAASAIATYLLGESGPHVPLERPVAAAAAMNFDYWEVIPRQKPSRIGKSKAISSFDEICKTISKKGAESEAARCEHCGVSPEFQADTCRGCNNCSSRCPSYAIELRKLETPYTVKVDVDEDIKERVKEICFRAKIHPESIVCFCTATRAMEIAAAIVKGAKKPEDVSRMTGARTGCGVLCIQPIFRLLMAAGIELEQPNQSDVWYPTVPTIWAVTGSVIKKYGNQGFRFEEDKIFYQNYITRK
jgi:NADPH-dependent glutamate synthase beta subunit-like oxidoreductase/bacterioferritin-associated ferredoxin/Pyruvate/2-oxoacid:ferredoxin oxidoreductase delta subunit